MDLLATDFQQAHRRSGCRAFALENSRILFLERFERSVAIERLERFESAVVGQEAIAIGKLEFVAKVKSELGLKASRREVIFRF